MPTISGSSPGVDQRGRYSNLPSSRLHALRKLVHGDFAKQIGELHRLLIKPKKVKRPGR